MADIESTPRWQMRWAVRQELDIAKYPDQQPNEASDADSIATSTAESSSAVTWTTSSTECVPAAIERRPKQLQERRQPGKCLSITTATTTTNGATSASGLSSMSVESDGDFFNFPFPPTPRTPRDTGTSPNPRRSRSPVLVVEGTDLFATTPSPPNIRKRPRRSSSADSALPPIPKQTSTPRETQFKYPSGVWNQVIAEKSSEDQNSEFDSEDSDCESDATAETDCVLQVSSNYVARIVAGQDLLQVPRSPRIEVQQYLDAERNPLRAPSITSVATSRATRRELKKKFKAPLSSQLDNWIDDLHK